MADTTRENVLAALRQAKAQMRIDLAGDDRSPPEMHLRTLISAASGHLVPTEPEISDELWSILEVIHNAGF